METTWSIANLERHTADGDAIIPYEELTKAVVVGWVKDKLGEDQVASTEAALAAQIDEQRAPTKASGTPW